MRLGDPRQIELAIHAFAVVNVVRDDANLRRQLRQGRAGECHQRTHERKPIAYASATRITVHSHRLVIRRIQSSDFFGFASFLPVTANRL